MEARQNALVSRRHPGECVFSIWFLGVSPLSLPTFIFGSDFICELDDEVQLFSTAPDGNPTGLSVAFASEEAAQFGYLAVELSNG